MGPTYLPVYHPLVKFRRGSTSISNDPRPRGPKTATAEKIVHKIHDLILPDCRVKVRELAALNASAIFCARSWGRESYGCCVWSHRRTSVIVKPLQRCALPCLLEIRRNFCVVSYLLMRHGFKKCSCITIAHRLTLPHWPQPNS